MTRGSFYYHFENRKDLLDTLLRDWEVRNKVEIAQVRDRWADSNPDLSEIVLIWLGEDPNFLAFDMAIRLWARRVAAVAKAVHRVDETWIKLLTDLFEKSGFALEESLIRARVTYFHQIGYNALNVKEDLSERLKLVPLYYQVLTGKRPGEQLEAVITKLTKRRSTSR